MEAGQALEIMQSLAGVCVPPSMGGRLSSIGGLKPALSFIGQVTVGYLAALSLSFPSVKRSARTVPGAG